VAPALDIVAAVSSSDESVIGLVGRIVTATRGPHGLGEVEIRVRGGTEVFLARSATPLPRGQTVVVLSAASERTVLVEPWLDPFESIIER
jgi:membrane-bound ClpP family serine protease